MQPSIKRHIEAEKRLDQALNGQLSSIAEEIKGVLKRHSLNYMPELAQDTLMYALEEALLETRIYPPKPERQSKPESKIFVSERIINLAQLEDRIQVARISVDVLKKELSKTAPSKDTIDRAVNTAVDALHTADGFELILEKRSCIFTEDYERKETRKNDKGSF